jgi:hypothetical protein
MRPDRTAPPRPSGPCDATGSAAWYTSIWVPRTVSRALSSAFVASRPRSHGSQAAQQDLPPWPFDSRT